MFYPFKAYQIGPFEDCFLLQLMFLRKCTERNFKGIRTFEVGMDFLVKGDDPALLIYVLGLSFCTISTIHFFILKENLFVISTKQRKKNKMICQADKTISAFNL